MQVSVLLILLNQIFKNQSLTNNLHRTILYKGNLIWEREQEDGYSEYLIRLI